MRCCKGQGFYLARILLGIKSTLKTKRKNVKLRNDVPLSFGCLGGAEFNKTQISDLKGGIDYCNIVTKNAFRILSILINRPMRFQKLQITLASHDKIKKYTDK